MTRKTAAVLLVLSLAVLALAALPAAGLAAKGGNGGNTSQGGGGKGGGGGKPGGGGSSGSLTLVVLDPDDGGANYGEQVTFQVSTTATDRPYVGLRCWQGTGWVYDGYVGYFPTYMGDSWLTLGGLYWDPALGASCTARLFYYDSKGNQNVLATLDFPVAP